MLRHCRPFAGAAARSDNRFNPNPMETIMQVKQITIGSSYAVKYDGKLYALQVRKIVTTKIGPHASDHKHVISGIIAGDAPKALDDRTFDLSEILGPFEDYSELVRQKAEAKAKAEAEDTYRKQRQGRLLTLLYTITGLKKAGDYSDPFRGDYSGGLDISAKAVEPLIAALEKLTNATGRLAG